MELPFCGLRVFVATRREQVPPECVRYLSVDGSVPGAGLTWDHHVTGERINLEAMPAVIDAQGFDGVGTTLADTDALASVLAVMAGGASRLPAATRAVLEAASHRCDHLRAHPDHGGETDRLGVGLNGWVSEALARGESFVMVCAAVAQAVAANGPLPYSTAAREAAARAAEELDRAGRIERHGAVAQVDLRGVAPLGPEATYARFDCPVAVAVAEHPAGGVRYTVGVNPFAASRPRSLRPCLAALARAEFALGPPTVSPEPVAGAENWGGRATVFGSPWNYGSRLSPEVVVATVAATLPPREAWE